MKNKKPIIRVVKCAAMRRYGGLFDLRCDNPAIDGKRYCARCASEKDRKCS